MKLNLAIRTLVVLAAVAIAGCQSKYPPFIQPEESSAQPTPKQKHWALALAAVSIERNEGRLDVLGGSERTPETIEEDRELLATWWHIKSRKDLISTLAWIERGGDRREFDELAKKLTEKPDQVGAVTSGPVIHSKLDVVSKHRDALAGKSIAGWDFGRYVALCGWGYVAGYLTEEEAWHKIMPVARTMQATFSSWDDFGANYMIGRQYWSPEQSKSDSGKMVGRAYLRLLIQKDSPWVRIPWNLDLAANATGKKSPPSRP